MRNAICILLLLVFMKGCSPPNVQQTKELIQEESNPAAAGFDAENSDSLAIVMADEVMDAMGGRKNWDETRYLYWGFFGARTLLWDKHKNRVRIESDRDSFRLVLNMNDMQGKVWHKGEEYRQPDSLKKYLGMAHELWVNDSYWLVMPFKLKDSGVTLKYVKEDTNGFGKYSDVLSLTFREVGVTPQNKYHVWIDKESRLITQWSFYSNSTDTIHRFITPWNDYRQHGNIMLSGNRGTYELTDILVLDSVSEEAFSSLKPFSITAQ